MPTRLSITAGEPAGIGPDLCVMVAQQPWPVPLLVIGDPDLLTQRATALRLPPDSAGLIRACARSSADNRP
mgnify:CR=1 FL=1